MKQIIILNGPPRSGKDTLAAHLVAQNPKHVVHLKFANELKKLAHRLYATPDQAPNAYEAFKDQPMTEFLGLTPRQVYINLSEDYIKRHHGPEFFGLQLIGEIKRRPHHDDNVFVVSDGGFIEELEPLLCNFSPALFTVVQIHRPGCTFDNDSRHYFNPDRLLARGVKFVTTNNDPCLGPDPTTFCNRTTAQLISLLGPDLFGAGAVNNVLNC